MAALAVTMLAMVGVPSQSQAGTVTVLNAIPSTPQINVAAATGSTTFAIGAGSNRLLVAVICINDGGAATHTASPITYGGKPLIAAAVSNANRRDVLIYYLKESDIATRSGDTFSLTISGGAPTGLSVYLASFTDVDQTTPINGNYSGYINNTAATLTFGTGLAVLDGGYSVFGVATNNTGTPSVTESYTLTPITLQGTNNIVGYRSFVTGTTTNPTLTYAANIRGGIGAVTINPNPCSVSAPADLAAPSVGSSSVDLTWTADLASNDLGYDVYRNGVKINGAPVMGGSYTDSTVSPSTTYNAPGYQVMGLATCGNSPLSAAVPVTTAAITNGTTVGALSFSGLSMSSITVEANYAGDDNNSNTCNIIYSTSPTYSPYSTAPAPTRVGKSWVTTVGGLSESTLYYFRATFNDTDAPAVTNVNADGSQSTTANLLMHGSANLGIKYGTWGAAFTCATCHAKAPATGSNIKRIRTTINAPGEAYDGRSVVAADASVYGANNTTHASSDKVCEVCHSQPAVHKYNQAAAVNHYGNSCTGCHQHKSSFKPPTDCALCHAAGTGLGGAPIVFDPAGGTVNGGSEAYGAHLKALKTDTLDLATDWEAQCQKCHGLHDGDVQVANNATVGINYAAHGGIWLGGTATGGMTTEAQICWSCHDNAANGVSEWGANAGTGSTYDYGSLQGTSNWVGAVWDSANFAYKTGPIASTHSVNATVTKPGVDAVGDIRCSYCHDVHNTALEYGVTADVDNKPYLRGSWKGNPYQEDGAPLSGNTYANISSFGAVPRGGSGHTEMGGYWIDQNSGNPTATWTLADSAGLCTICHTGSVDSMNQFDVNEAGSGEIASQSWVGTNGHSAAVIGGTGSVAANIYQESYRTTWGLTPLSTADYQNAHRPRMAYTHANGGRGAGLRDNNSLAGKGFEFNPAIGGNESRAFNNFDWGVTTDDATLDANFHNFSCSKCHNPHASRLPRLMITNCLDTKHNTWDDGYTSVGNTTNLNGNATIEAAGANGNVTMSNVTSAQNCHRVPDPAFGKAVNAGGWNNVTPW